MKKIFRIVVLAWMINFVLFIIAVLFEILVLPSGAVVPEWIDSWWDGTMVAAAFFPPLAIVTYFKELVKNVKDFINGD